MDLNILGIKIMKDIAKFLENPFHNYPIFSGALFIKKYITTKLVKTAQIDPIMLIYVLV